MVGWLFRFLNSFVMSNPVAAIPRTFSPAKPKATSGAGIFHICTFFLFKTIV